jgi:DeoR/GlpR family transcriptional regulator of sugar metabolism
MKGDLRSVIRRLAWIHRELQAARPVSYKIIMEKWGVSKPTAKRDMKFLRNEFCLEIKWKQAERTYRLSGEASNFLTDAEKME